MSNSTQDDFAELVPDNEPPQRSSPTRRVAAYHSEFDVVGRSQAFIEVMKQVERVANTHSPVLLTGESSVAKQLLASAIHHRSVRRDYPFIALNCASFAPDAMAAALFDAAPDRNSLWKKAGGGSVFLDEITNTDSSFQSRLFEALKTGVNVRLMAGSIGDAEAEVVLGRLRADLFHYLNAVSIKLPSGCTIKPAEVDQDLVPLSAIEGRYVARVLKHTGGNKQAAARMLEIDRKTLDRMIKRHHIDCSYARTHRSKVSITS